MVMFNLCLYSWLKMNVLTNSTTNGAITTPIPNDTIDSMPKIHPNPAIIIPTTRYFLYINAPFPKFYSKTNTSNLKILCQYLTDRFWICGSFCFFHHLADQKLNGVLFSVAIIGNRGGAPMKNFFNNFLKLSSIMHLPKSLGLYNRGWITAMF